MPLVLRKDVGNHQQLTKGALCNWSIQLVSCWIILFEIIKQVRWWHCWVLQWLVWLCCASAWNFSPAHPPKVAPHIPSYPFLNKVVVFLPSPSSSTQHTPCVWEAIFKCLSWLCYGFVRICHFLSPGHPAKWVSRNYPWPSIYQPINILSVHEGAHHFPILLSWFFHYSIISVNSSLALKRTLSTDFDQTFDSNQWQSLVHFMHFVLCKAGCSKQLTKEAFSIWSIQCDYPLLGSWLKSKQLRQIPMNLPLQSNYHSLWGPSYCSKSQLCSLLFCIYSRVSSALCIVCWVHFWKLPQKE